MATAIRQVRFTNRQRQVVRLVARGFTHDEIGEELGISPRTAKAHCEEVRLKLNVGRTREIPLAYAAVTGDDPYPRIGGK